MSAVGKPLKGLAGFFFFFFPFLAEVLIPGCDSKAQSKGEVGACSFGHWEKGNIRKREKCREKWCLSLIYLSVCVCVCVCVAPRNITVLWELLMFSQAARG